jgi:hypothetical protein
MHGYRKAEKKVYVDTISTTCHPEFDPSPIYSVIYNQRPRLQANNLALSLSIDPHSESSEVGMLIPR